MYKLLYIIFVSLIVANCSLKPVVKHHGVPFLEKKQLSLIINESNKNDIIEIDSYGILKKKDFFNKDDLENIKFAKETTESEFKRNSFIYDFMSSMRQKINDPLGVRAKKRKEISQR